MKYRDLIQFEPILDVIQLQLADQHDYARKMVSTYVVSDRMADILLNRLLPVFRKDDEKPAMGLFIVGNYGTGKSHLMAVLTSILEDESLLTELTNPAIADGFREVAGTFMVSRQETSGVETQLRNIIFNKLEGQLKKWGVNYHFQSIEKATSNKDLLLEMMDAFHKKYPDKGLLIALDELLDYLRSRKDHELMLDLSFLREIGEVCAQTQLRFIAGVQEALFDNDRFQFVADSIRRVQTRFEQVQIVREDVAYVISRRLLAKTPEQRRKIRTYLEPFAPLYDSMIEHMDAFIELFPVHPAYLEIFENVTVVEKRELLKAISQQMTNWLDDEVPTDYPGIFSFDAYWNVLIEDSSYRTIPQVRDVQERVKVLQERIKTSIDKTYLSTAQRIIAGLAINRLTLRDIYAPIGLKPIELRDRLCLHLPIPEKTADFLLSSVATVLQEIIKAVSGQFISHNEQNDQYYLDLKKDVDFDAQIDQRAQTLEKDQLDRYYFEVLARALELTEGTYVPGFKIWQREISWPGQGITRPGYFFLGAPNERSTAQPPRDFYIHFLALYGNHVPQGRKEPDELYFRLSESDTEFETLIKRFAGAREMSILSTGATREQYDRKADGFLKNMANWLREHLIQCFEVTFKGAKTTISQLINQHHLSIRDLNFRDQVFKLASACLSESFQAKYPQYPLFQGIEITSVTLSTTAISAIRILAGQPAQLQGRIVLEGLGLVVSEGSEMRHQPEASPYARYFLEKLQALPKGSVLNRKDLISGPVGAEKDAHFQLELEWLVVILLAQVRQGEINLHMRGLVIDSSNLSEAFHIPIEDLTQFTSINQPKPMPEQVLRALFEGLEVPIRWVGEPKIDQTAIDQFQAIVLLELENVTPLLDWLHNSPRYWRETILSDADLQSLKKNLNDYKDFLESLQRLSSPGSLRHFEMGVGDVRRLLKTRPAIKNWLRLKATLQTLQPLLDVIYYIEITLPKGEPWFNAAETTKSEQLHLVQNLGDRFSDTIRSRLAGGLENLRAQYSQRYIELHDLARLDTKRDEKKRRLTTDPRWVQLRALAAFGFLPAPELKKIDDALKELHSCPGVSLADLQQHNNCPSCGYVPTIDRSPETAEKRLIALNTDFEALYKRWIAALLSNLDTSECRQNITLLNIQDRKLLEDFIQTKLLPEKITERFITSLKDALQGLEKVTIKGEELLLAMSKPSLPCTVEDLNKRYFEFISSHIQGNDLHKLRIQIDW